MILGMDQVLSNYKIQVTNRQAAKNKVCGIVASKRCFLGSSFVRIRARQRNGHPYFLICTCNSELITEKSRFNRVDILGKFCQPASSLRSSIGKPSPHLPADLVLAELHFDRISRRSASNDQLLRINDSDLRV